MEKINVERGIKIGKLYIRKGLCSCITIRPMIGIETLVDPLGKRPMISEGTLYKMLDTEVFTITEYPDALTLTLAGIEIAIHYADQDQAWIKAQGIDIPATFEDVAK